jgi:hypothetical protein
MKHVGTDMMSISQIPENWPVVTPEAVLLGIIVFIVVTFIAYYITHSRWSWLPGIVFGVIAAIALTQYPITQLTTILGIFDPRLC